jgi:predicted O-linked N-acetylglucosamine transferase (SPINDLY family)
VYLPDTYQCNDSKRHIADSVLTRADVGLPTQGFVFCSFNNNYKIRRETFEIWMRLLDRTEGSVLWLLESNPSAVRNLRLEAQRRGIAAERLVFAPNVEYFNHLARHRLADLFLDSLPTCAHTTASDALWAGLPVLTCLGESFAGRVAASLLSAIGLPELVARSLEEYEAKALDLASDPSALAAVKAKLARNRDTHPLFDTVRVTRHLESAYTRMIEIYRKQRVPESFSVDVIGDTKASSTGVRARVPAVAMHLCATKDRDGASGLVPHAIDLSCPLFIASLRPAGAREL